MPRFANTSCAQCGRDLGPGDAGTSHCDQHAAKHTPGPWQYVLQKDWPHAQRVYITRLDWGVVAEARVDPGLPHLVDQQRANLRLIAAAPDLLEALQDCREALRRADAVAELCIVDAAIAKATGSAS